MRPFERIMRDGGRAALEQVSRFFMRDDPVHESLRRITGKLEQLSIPYAVVGGMALVAHGYGRTTEDVVLLVTPEGLEEVHKSLDGLGYVPPFPGASQLRDTQKGVRIEFVVTGRYPGDGKPKPIPFPSPLDVAVEIDGIRYVALPVLIELKLASGMTNPGRLRDLADVQELIRVLGLPADYAAKLHPYVRDRFTQLWDGLRSEHSSE